MRGRRKLPVLAEISARTGESRAWSLRRADLEALAKPRALLGGRRVVLVSGDERLAGAVALAAARRGCPMSHSSNAVRQPGALAAELGLAPAPGLHEYLRWEATAAEILQPLVLAGPAAQGASDPLVCTVAGRAATNPATLIALESFRHALAKLRAAYDLTVLIGPPLEVVRGSPEAIAEQADAVIAAVSPRGIKGQPGRLLRAQLRRLRTETLGVVVVVDSD
jgi:hypothetical protein